MKLTSDKVKLHRRRDHFKLTLIFSACVVAVILAVVLLVGGTLFVLVTTGVFAVDSNTDLVNGKLLLGLTLLAILVVGSILTYLAGRIVMHPVNVAIEGMNSLADGNFGTRLSFKGPFSRQPPLSTVARSFNKMAAELEGTEMLRSDFVNNFSHEFKTPIVSIAGFSHLLREGNLSPEEEQEYLAIIEDESRRLAGMASNVLILTRIENRQILNEVETFNLSEQIRDCVLLLQSKWEAKELVLALDFGEVSFTGEARLLREVWLNLLDNAVKYTPAGGTISVSIQEEWQDLRVTVENTGSVIPPEEQDRIFRKFYQTDRSHSGSGNGIGLSIVKSVAELHGGSVEVSSGDGRTAFTVILPR